MLTRRDQQEPIGPQLLHLERPGQRRRFGHDAEVDPPAQDLLADPFRGQDSHQDLGAGMAPIEGHD
jgi:hypothetical protein